MKRSRNTLRTRVLLFMLLCLAAVGFGVMPALAQTPVPVTPMTTQEVLNGAFTLINSLGLLVLVLVAAFVAIGAMIIRRFRRAAG